MFTCSCNSSNCAGDHSTAEELSFALTNENSERMTLPSEKIYKNERKKKELIISILCSHKWYLRK